MNIKEKIDDLLKYCSSYQGHTYIMDERREDQTFQVLLPEEQDIMERMDKLHFITQTSHIDFFYAPGEQALIQV